VHAWIPELAFDWYTLLEENSAVMLAGVLPRLPAGVS
jgi:hypothetical protein